MEREMTIYHLSRVEYAISQLVGALIMVIIAVIAFAMIMSYVFPLPFPVKEPNVDVTGYTHGFYGVLEHVGGESVFSYEIISQGGTITSARLADENNNGAWDIGESVRFMMTQNSMKVSVIDTSNGDYFVVFDGVLETDEKMDFDPPVIIDNSPDIGYTGDPYTFNITVYDEDPLVFVYVNWRHGYFFGNTSMIQIGSTDFYEATILLDHNLSNLSYFFYAEDSWRNPTKTGDNSAKILDNDPPEISDLPLSPWPIHVNDFFNITATITDNIALGDAYANVTYPSGFIANSSMINAQSTNTYYHNTTYPELGEYNYFIWAQDTSNNTATSVEKLFQAYLEGSNLPPVQGDPFLFSSLMTNTVDEDLICRNNTIFDPEGNNLTIIYNWYQNGEALAELLLPFDTESVAIIKDYSGNNNNGTVYNGAQWTDAGKIGGAYVFDGDNDYISVDLPDVFNDISNNDFTISLWIKSTDISTNWVRILDARKDNDNFVQIFQYESTIQFGVEENGVKEAVKTATLSSLTWYHIVCVWDASENSMKIYANGEENEETGNRNYGPGSNNRLDLGQRTDNDKRWEGIMDQLIIYDRVLSPDQIYQNYLCTKDGASNVSVIVAEETLVGDNWKCVLTPNDGYQDGFVKESDLITII